MSGLLRYTFCGSIALSLPSMESAANGHVRIVMILLLQMLGEPWFSALIGYHCVSFWRTARRAVNNLVEG